MKWIIKPFAELSLLELYDVMVLRQAIFIVEQNCPYLDADGKDLNGTHLLGYEAEKLVAYARLLPQGVSYPDAVSIGRVVNAAEVRGRGVGRDLMQQAIAAARQLFGNQVILISAQCYLTRFYESFGFVAVGTPYLEDDIPHIKMRLDAQK